MAREKACKRRLQPKIVAAAMVVAHVESRSGMQKVCKRLQPRVAQSANDVSCRMTTTRGAWLMSSCLAACREMQVTTPAAKGTATKGSGGNRHI